LHFVSRLDNLSGITANGIRSASLDGVVIESQASDEPALRDLIGSLAGNVPVLYLTTDPYDPAIPGFKEVGAVWAWDAGCISSLAAGQPSPAPVCTEAGRLEQVTGTAFEVAGPTGDNELDKALSRLWDDLTEIQRHPGGPSLETVQWVWGMFGALSHLIVPVNEYDRYARSGWGTTSIADGVLKVRAFARNAPRQEDREYWHLLADDLEDAVAAARRSNPKPEGLALWVRELIYRGGTGRLVVRNRAAQQAVRAHLQARPDVPFGWDGRIDIVTFADVSAGRTPVSPADILFPGPVASRYAGFFALPPTRRLTVLTHGAWETSRVVRQVEGVAARLASLAHGETRTDAVRILLGGRDLGPECTPSPPRLTHSGVLGPGVPKTSREAVWDPFDVSIVRSVGRDDRDVEGPTQDSPQGPRAVVRSLCLDFTDGTGFFEPDSVISRVEGRELKDVAVKALLPGDRIILVELGARRNLFDLIVEKLEDLPEFAATAILVHEWHERAHRAAYSSGLTYDDILRRMRGTAITSTQTIGTWIRGTVHGPGDPEDIRRFGVAVGDRFLAERFQAIGRALATMRSHRQKIGHMLARVLSGMSNADLEDEGYFDRRLGIHWSDFAEAVSYHQVTAVSKRPVTIPYPYANRLLSWADAARLGGPEDIGK
jgi:hypothetical protein